MIKRALWLVGIAIILLILTILAGQFIERLKSEQSDAKPARSPAEWVVDQI